MPEVIPVSSHEVDPTKAATIRKRKKVETPWSDSYVTPRWLAEMLPTVDIDPCSNYRSWIKAHWAYSLEKGLDGLKLPWRGSAFINWPYSSPRLWAAKTMNELASGVCTQAIVLCKLDPSTSWFRRMVSFDSLAAPGEILCEAPDLWLFDKRIQFEEPPEALEARRKIIAEWTRTDKKPPAERTSSNIVSVIIHHRGISPVLNLGSVATRWRRAGVPS